MYIKTMLGEYQTCKHDPEPGAQIMWRGQERLSAATVTCEIKVIVYVQNTVFCPRIGQRAGLTYDSAHLLFHFVG